jgi:hypothetical protein
MLDLITGRDISAQCWNGGHARVVRFELYGASWNEKFGCKEKSCGCLCHPRNQLEPVPVVPGFEDPCPQCFGLREVAANSGVPIPPGGKISFSSLSFIPCPKCCSAVSSEKENV